MKSTLTLALLAFFFLQAQCAPHDLDKIEQMGDECAEEVHMNKTIVEEAVKTLVLPTDRVYKDFLFCMYKKQGYQSKDGSFNQDNLKKFLKFYISSPAVDGIVAECTENVKGNDPGEIAFNALQCLLPKLTALDDEETSNETE